jgi:hypothetical protein
MAEQNVIQDHFTAADQVAWDAAILVLRNIVEARLRNLSEEENQKYGTIDEKNKLLVEKVNDYRDTKPHLSCGDVDWVEFKADRFDRRFLETGALDLTALSKSMLETKRPHDYDNYQNALIDYAYSQFKERTQAGLGYDVKVAELKQFFPNTQP